MTRATFSWIFTLLPILLIASAGHSDQINVGFGPSLDSTNFQPHVGSVQYEKDLGQFALVGSATAIFENGVVGAFTVIPSAKIVTPGGMFLRAGVGIGLVTRTYDRLSSIGEFNIEAVWGLTWDRLEGGVRFDHLSNGSILGKGPNLGQDAAQLHLGYRFL